MTYSYRPNLFRATFSPYAGLDYLDARWRGSVAATRRARRWHVGFALLALLAAGLYAGWELFAPRHGGARLEQALIGLFLIASAHGFLALPFATCWRARTEIDAAHRGIGGAPLDLLAIPEYPRPLYFHAQRAALLPLLEEHARTGFATALAYAALIEIVLVGTSADHAATRSAWEAAGPAIIGLAAWGFVAGIGAVVSLIAAAMALSWLVGFASGLGEIGRFAIKNELSRRDWTAIAARDDLDEAWGNDKGEGAGRYLSHGLRRAFVAGAGVATLVAGQAAAVAAIYRFMDELVRPMSGNPLHALPAGVAIILAIEGLFAAFAYPILRAIDRAGGDAAAAPARSAP